MSTQTTDQNWHRKTLNTPLLICLLVWFKRKWSEWSCWLQIISWKHWSTRQHIPPQCLQWFHREPLVFRSDPTVSFNVTFIHVTQEDLSSCETRGRWWVLKGCDMTKCCWMLNRSEISCCCKSAALQRDVRRRRGGRRMREEEEYINTKEKPWYWCTSCQWGHWFLWQWTLSESSEIDHQLVSEQIMFLLSVTHLVVLQ